MVKRREKTKAHDFKSWKRKKQTLVSLSLSISPFFYHCLFFFALVVFVCVVVSSTLVRFGLNWLAEVVVVGVSGILCVVVFFFMDGVLFYLQQRTSLFFPGDYLYFVLGLFFLAWLRKKLTPTKNNQRCAKKNLMACVWIYLPKQK